MASKLGLYNRALFHLGERKLASLTEDRKPRRVLDDIYDDALVYCLEQGQWNFAMRAVEIASEASVEPAFGYQHAFAKPDDWLRTVAVSADETFHPDSLTAFNDERGYWWADVDPLYVRYVSSDTEYGLDLSLWPQTFAEYVALYLADQACESVTGSDAKAEKIAKRMRDAKADALAKDAVNEGPQFLPSGTWALARSGGSGVSWRRRTKGY